ncbi:hypothetical protein GN244_ATG15111 [Phytophthora infestans]|uniref:Uncharacterized protein n=1 Tax=Phytophthora infestans TaxID=4787 RepID=A0A833W7X1_PHYIN|nr:hypothetical protein GN244_ATG15111 [Phytophthora infestans]
MTGGDDAGLGVFEKIGTVRRFDRRKSGLRCVTSPWTCNLNNMLRWAQHLETAPVNGTLDRTGVDVRGISTTE